MISKAVIDYTAFFSHDRSAVFIKELSIMDVETTSVLHWVFKPPKDSEVKIMVTSLNRWLTNYFHGLEVFTGTSDYSSLKSALEFISDEVKLLYAPSAEKAKFLEKLFGYKRVVFNLEALGCPRLNNEVVTSCEGGHCLVHHVYAPGFYCTQDCVRRLVKWCSENPTSIDMNNPDIRAKTFVNWKLSKPTVKELTDHGFVFFIHSEDSVKCVYCGLCLYEWKEGDVVQEDHDRNSPFCIYRRYRQQQTVRPDADTNESTDVDDDHPVCCFKHLNLTKDDVFNVCQA